jgi:hypothetical protein
MGTMACSRFRSRGLRAWIWAIGAILRPLLGRASISVTGVTIAVLSLARGCQSEDRRALGPAQSPLGRSDPPWWGRITVAIKNWSESPMAKDPPTASSRMEPCCHGALLNAINLAKLDAGVRASKLSFQQRGGTGARVWPCKRKPNPLNRHGGQAQPKPTNCREVVHIASAVAGLLALSESS